MDLLEMHAKSTRFLVCYERKSADAQAAEATA